MALCICTSLLWGNEIIVYHSPIVDIQFDNFLCLPFLPCIVKQNNASLHYKCNFAIGTIILHKHYCIQFHSTIGTCAINSVCTCA